MIYRVILSVFILCAVPVLAAKKSERPSGPNHDLTKEIDFPRVSNYPLGPTGLHGWMYTHRQMTRDARQILITQIEEGSPSDGKILEGDVILGVNGKKFDFDARRSMGAAIDVSEASGSMELFIWRPDKDADTRTGKEQTITISIPKQASFSTTAPFNCERSKQLLIESLDRVAEQVKQGKIGRVSELPLALLAGGRPEDLKIVRDYLHEADWVKPDYHIGLETGGLVVWRYGMRGLTLAEYFMLTGDEYVLPALKEHAVKVAMGQGGNGTWGHGFAWVDYNDGKLHGHLKGYGGLNLAGLPCLLTMVLAERCGITDPEIEAGVDRGLDFFSSFVGHGTIGYGYHRPSLDHYNNGHNGYGSNGKNAIASLIFSAAGDQRVSNYFSMLMTSAYDEREYGHAGNTFNQYWGLMGVYTGGPEAVVGFHKQRRWYHALGRGWDGRIMYQQLGGYYGGVTLDLDAGRVMRNALPLNKLLITGRDPDEKLWLNDNQVKDALDAGSWHWADYKSLSSDDVIANLDCWSPVAREWMAVALAKREGIVDALIKQLDSKSPDMRAGAAASLGYQREKAASAVDKLIELLSDEAPQVQVAVSHALMRIGQPAYKAIPSMMSVISTLQEEEPLEPVLQAMAYCLSAPPSRWAPLYFDGILHTMPQDPNPLSSIDKEVLYPFMRRVMAADNARVRLCATSLFKHLDYEDVVALSSEIYQATRYRAPNMPMFEALARREGMDLMARFNITEGVGLTTHSLVTKKWGAQWREPHHFLVLQNYGQLARPALDDLYTSRWVRRNSDTRKILEDTIAEIEKGPVHKRYGLSILELAEKHFEKQAKSTLSPKLCRKMIVDYPDAHLQTIIALRYLADQLGAEAAPHIIDALAARNDLLENTAIALAVTMQSSPKLTSTWLKALKKSEDTHQIKGLLRLLGSTGSGELKNLTEFLSHENEGVRRAAMLAIGDRGGKAALPLLMNVLTQEPNRRERRDCENAIALCYQGLEDPTTTWPTEASEDTRASLITALGNSGSASSVKTLLSLVSEPSGLARTAAIDRLSVSPQKGVIAHLFTLAEADADKRRQQDILLAILQRVVCRTEDGRDRLADLEKVRSLTDHHHIHREVLRELPWCNDKQAVGIVLSYLDSEDKKMKGLKKDASRYGLEVAQRLSGDPNKGVSAKLLNRIVAVNADPDTVSAAKALLAGTQPDPRAK